MHGEPVRYSAPKVEAKVKAMAVAAYLGFAALLFVLELVGGNLALIDFLPGWTQAIVVPLLPTAVATVAGWKAKHTPRPDLPAHQR